MKPDDFENRLEQQPLRQVPAEWRAEILGAARPRRSAPGPQPSWLASFFWPHPKAWVALAAVWVLIFAMNILSRDKPNTVAQVIAPPSPQVVAVLQQQRRLLKELIGQTSALEAEPQERFLPRPRSERRNALQMA